MILEHALFAIKQGQSKSFEAAFAQARKYIETAPGCRGIEMRACLEQADSYLLLARWESVEAHTKGFRDSQAFIEWRTILGPHFAAPPEVHHYDVPL